MTGANLLAAYSEIALDDRFPVLGVTASGVDSTFALFYLNVAARRVMTLLELETKATLSFTSGTLTYALSGFSIPLYRVNKLKVNDSYLEKATMEDTYGWYVNGTNLIFNENFATSSTVTAYGFRAPVAIVNTAVEVADIPADCHLAVAQLAIVEGIGSHRESMADVMQLERLAVDSVMRYRARNMSNTAPMALFDGSK